jgi:molybdate transport system regulatory protein
MEPRLRLWVTFGERTKFGDGRARLLERIDRLGSINKAVAEAGMSYRTAWGYIQELERAAGFTFLERRPGGGGSGGARLTREGRAFLDRYWAFRKGLESVMVSQFDAAFRRPASRRPSASRPRTPRAK